MAGGFPPHGGRRPGAGGAHGGPPREYVRVTPDGEVQVMFRGNPLVTVRGEGEVVLDTAGHHNGTVLGVLKRALRPMGVRLTAQTENFAEDWSVEDGTNFTRFQDFSTPFSASNAKPAGLTFAGDTYVGLAAHTFDEQDWAFAQDHLGILSGLFGLLRPLDYVQAYRLEMGTRLKTDSGSNLYEFWGESITKTLKKDLAAVKGTTLVNLASDEYAKAIQLDKLGGDVINVKFLQKDAGKEKFISFFAKRARGLMARWMSTDRPSKPADLSGFNLEGYRIKKSASSENELVFVRPKPAAKKKAS